MCLVAFIKAPFLCCHLFCPVLLAPLALLPELVSFVSLLSNVEDSLLRWSYSLILSLLAFLLGLALISCTLGWWFCVSTLFLLDLNDHSRAFIPILGALKLLNHEWHRTCSFISIAI